MQGHQQQGNQSSNASTSQPSENQSPESGSREQAISDEAFTQLVSGITGYMSQAAVGQAPRQTIAEFLSGLGQNYSIPQGEGISLSDISRFLNVTFKSLKITIVICQS